jgi:hypothetical protein
MSTLERFWRSNVKEIRYDVEYDPVTFKHQNCQQRNETVVTMATIVRVRLIGVLVASGVVTVPLKVRHPGTISSGPLSRLYCDQVLHM